MPPLTSADVLTFLIILIGIMVVVVLYHMLFIVVDLRRILKKVDRVTTQVEEFILKPIAIMDQVVTALLDLFDGKKKQGTQGFNKRHLK
jgi:hypothetical protein